MKITIKAIKKKHIPLIILLGVLIIVGVFLVIGKSVDTYVREEEEQKIALTTPVVRNENLAIGGWLVRWNNGRGIADAREHMDVFSTLSPFSYEITRSGNVSDVLRLTLPLWSDVLREAKENSVTIIPSFLWMDKTAMTTVLQDGVKRSSLAKQITYTINTMKVDGADIDFEGMAYTDHEAFISFLKELDSQLENKILTCTIAATLPTADEEAQGSLDKHYKELGELCDEVRVMAYDMRFADPVLAKKEPAPYIPSADVRTVRQSIEYLATFVPREKIVLGIASYGYEYEVTEKATSTSYRLLWSFSPSYAKGLVAKKSLELRRGDHDEAYATYRVGTKQTPSKPFILMEPFVTESAPKEPKAPYNVIWWSDTASVEGKLELAKSLGLKGISLFRLNGDTDQELWKVLQK